MKQLAIIGGGLLYTVAAWALLRTVGFTPVDAGWILVAGMLIQVGVMRLLWMVWHSGKR